MKYFIFFALLIMPLMSVEAQGTVIEAGRTAIVGLPGVPAGSDFNTYMNALYALSITIAALLAVIKIIIAGVKWMLTDVVTSKEEAKKDIKGSLLGLLIVLAAVLIISVINRNILDVNLELTPLAAPTDSVPTNNGGGGVGGNPAAGTIVGGGGGNPTLPTNTVQVLACASNTDCTMAMNICNAYNNQRTRSSYTINSGQVTCSISIIP
jgi:hypothetical protein